MSEPQLTFLSFGGGQDSTDLLFSYAIDESFRRRFAPYDFIVIMSDTGDEHPATRRHVQEVARFCRERGIPFHLIVPQMGFHSGKWTGLREFYRATNTCGSKAFPKSCTDHLKIRPIYRFLERHIEETYGFVAGRKQGLLQFVEHYGKIRCLLGIAKGEERRVSNGEGDPVWMQKTIEKRYPLIELGRDRAACQQHIRDMGFPVPPPSNCMLCPYMSEVELVWLYLNHPTDYSAWVEIERRKIQANLHKGEKNLGVWGSRTLPEVLEGALKKYGHMTKEQLDGYKFSHGSCTKSKY